MVHATSAAHGVLLKLTKSWCGLSGVTHTAVRTFESATPLVRGTRDPREVSHEVQEGAFGNEQCAKRSLQIHHHAARMHTLTVNDANINSGQWEANGLQHEKRDRSAADNPMFTSNDLRASTLVETNRRVGCDVGTVAKIFVERRIHKATHLERIEASLF
jgi:hypothetical protein